LLCKAFHACQQNHFHCNQNAEAGDAGHSPARELCGFDHGHMGKIYQASNWLFVGETGHEAGIMLNGKLTHRRTINSKYGTSTIEWLHEHVDPCASRVEGKPKFKYLLPLDDEIAERTKKLAQTYPKIRATSETSDTPGVHPGKGRAARTVAL